MTYAGQGMGKQGQSIRTMRELWSEQNIV